MRTGPNLGLIGSIVAYGVSLVGRSYGDRQPGPKHPLRRILLAQIQEHPGHNIRALCKAFGTSRTTLAYHLRLLENAGVVESLVVGRQRHFFPTGIEEEAKHQIALVRRERILDLVIRIENSPGRTQTELRNQVGLTRKSFRALVDPVAKAGLISVRSANRRVLYFPTTQVRRLLRWLSDASWRRRSE